MGHMKNLMMEQQDALECAKGYLVTINVLNECGIHGYTEGGERTLNETWGIAVNDWKKGAEGRASWAAGLELAEYKALLQSAYDDNCGDCIGCTQAEAQ